MKLNMKIKWLTMSFVICFVHADGAAEQMVPAVATEVLTEQSDLAKEKNQTEGPLAATQEKQDGHGQTDTPVAQSVEASKQPEGAAVQPAVILLTVRQRIAIQVIYMFSVITLLHGPGVWVDMWRAWEPARTAFKDTLKKSRVVRRMDIFGWLATDKDRAYEILGLDQDASEQEIKSAYRRLALKMHPDKTEECKKNAASEECGIVNALFQRLAVAQECLLYGDAVGFGACKQLGM